MMFRIIAQTLAQSAPKVSRESEAGIPALSATNSLIEFTKRCLLIDQAGGKAAGEMKPAKERSLAADGELKGDSAFTLMFCRWMLLLSVWLVDSLLLASPAPPRLQFLLEGSWLAPPSGGTHDLKIVGNYGYAAIGAGGLAVLDLGDPSTPVCVSQCKTSGEA
jgi:hypothetical protein